MEKTIAEVTPRVAKLLLKMRDDIANDDISEAYHSLYQIASQNYDKLNPWEELEKIANDNT